MSTGYVLLNGMLLLEAYFVVIHIGVGYLGVARSDFCGQCEGL